MRLAVILTGLVLAPGCAELPGSSGEAPGAPAHTDRSLSGHNELSFNRLTLNRLTLNRLTLNRLTLNRLTLNRLTLNPLSGIHTTDSGRELLEYVAKCALDAEDTLVVTYEGNTYEFPGLLGLIRDWEDEPLEADDREKLSSCLLAHVNAFGVSVSISLRADGMLDFDHDEKTLYTVYEGTFFGDVTSDVQLMYACQGHWPVVALRGSSARADRVCADPSDECGIESLGRCRDICDSYTPKYGWTDCHAEGAVYRHAISAWLTRDNLGATDESCEDEGGRCSLECSDPASAGTLDCEGSADKTCRARCDHGTACNVTCDPDSRKCKTKCDRGSTCDIDCVEARNCQAKCRRGSQCEIDCYRADECHRAVCARGAECLLRCTDAVTCGFERCTGGEKSCPGDVVVCNRPCP